MNYKMTLTACAAALLLGGCATQEAPKIDNIVEYDAVLDRVHVRNDSLTQYGNTRAGAGIRQGEEYVHTLWGEHEAGETNEEKMAHAMGYESPKEKEARLAREKAAREAALKRAADKKARAKNGKKRRNGRDQSIYAYDQSVYGEKAPVAKKAKKDPSAAKRFVEKTTLTFPKKETPKEAIQKALVTPTQTQAATPAKVMTETTPAAQKSPDMKPVVAAEPVKTEAAVKPVEVVPQEKTPSVASVKTTVKEKAAVDNEEVTEKVQATGETIKDKTDGALQEAAMEVKKAAEPAPRHVIDPVIRNSGVNDTPILAPKVSDETVVTDPTVTKDTHEVETTTFGHPDGEPAPGAEVVPQAKP